MGGKLLLAGAMAATVMTFCASTTSRAASRGSAFVPALERFALSPGIARGTASSSSRCPTAIGQGSFHPAGSRGFSYRSFPVWDLISRRSSEAPVEEEADPGEIEGTDLRVLKYPHPKLRAFDEEITEFDADLKKTVKEMFMVMYACKGVGLAAPQVGINKRLMVFNPEGDPKKWPKEVVLVNPKIVGQSEATDVEPEGCLSFPGMDGNVRRHKWIKIEAQNLMGKPIKKKYEGWEARVFQHEYDHLEGKVYIDRLEEEEDKERVKPVLQGLIQKYKDEYGDDFAL